MVQLQRLAFQNWSPGSGDSPVSDFEGLLGIQFVAGTETMETLMLASRVFAERYNKAFSSRLVYEQFKAHPSSDQELVAAAWSTHCVVVRASLVDFGESVAAFLKAARRDLGIDRDHDSKEFERIWREQTEWQRNFFDVPRPAEPASSHGG